MSIEKVVAALNGAFAADPGAMRALVINHVPCNMGLVNDPYVICEEDRNLAGDHFTVGMLGVINGVLAAAGMTLVAAKWDMREDGPNIFAGFIAYIQPESVSSDEQTPEPDQYWQYKKSDDRVYFIGRTPYGEMVWQCEGDPVEVGNLDWSCWEYLPGCDSWEWKQNPAAEPVAVKAPSDVMGKSQDDWVPLDEKYDDCPLRAGYQFRRCASNTDWRTIGECDSIRGQLIKDERYDASGDWEFRCLRKDLPVINARIPVTLYWYDGAIVGRYADSPVTDPSFVPIHSDSNGGWFIERSTNAGN